MRREISIFLILFVISIGGYGYLAADLAAKQDDVVLEETVIYGDRSLADGLQIQLGYSATSKLLWKITYTLGEDALNSGIETEFICGDAAKEYWLADLQGFHIPEHYTKRYREEEYKLYDMEQSSFVNAEGVNAEDTDVWRTQIGADGFENRYLVRGEANYRVEVQDAKTKAVLHETEIEGCSADWTISRIYQYDDILMIGTQDESGMAGDFHVLRQEEDGSHVHLFTSGAIEEMADLRLYKIESWKVGPIWNGVTDSYMCAKNNTMTNWNGEMLTMVTTQWNASTLCGFYLTMINRDGLQYCGRYDCSLDYAFNLRGDEFDYGIWPTIQLPWTVEWRENAI
ncbi:MAG: hypothetical protein IJ468_01405 [Lachnospiraceae bacterium]|nr:hypothetical protein [Lachnospiraceae bacterium]